MDRKLIAGPMNFRRRISLNRQMKVGTITLDCALERTAHVAVVDRIARMRLEARRQGLGLELQNVSVELRALIEFCGLAAALGVEVERQPEQREQPGGVEEEGDLADPPS